MTSPARAYSAEHGMRRYAVDDLDPHPLSVTTLLRVIAGGRGLTTWLDKKLISAALDAYEKSSDAELAMSAGLRARWTSSEEADLGTAVHKLTEQADLMRMGKITQILPVADMKKATGYLNQWERCCDAFNIEVLDVEVTFVNTKEGYAGTADRVVIIPALSHDPLILDIKSGKGVWPDVALQCAALANCDKILHNDGTMDDIPWDLNKRYGVAAHLRPRSFKLIPADIEKAWPFFQPLPQLAMWRAEQIPVLGDPLIPDTIEHLRADLRYRLKNLPPDMQAAMRYAITKRDDLAGGTTLSWDETQLRSVESMFGPFEREARDRFELVVNKWGDRGDLELRAHILKVTGGQTSSVSELTAKQVDELIGSM